MEKLNEKLLGKNELNDLIKIVGRDKLEKLLSGEKIEIEGAGAPGLLAKTADYIRYIKTRNKKGAKLLSDFLRTSLERIKTRKSKERKVTKEKVAKEFSGFGESWKEKVLFYLNRR